MIHLKDKSFVPFLSFEEIITQIRKLATQIEADYTGRAPVFISVLNGSFLFTADLLKEVNLPLEIAFMKLSSYEGTLSSGQIAIDLDLRLDIAGRDVIILEDIIDTGATLHFLLQHLQNKGASSIKTASLLFKPAALQHSVPPDYCCFEIENKFVVGYGLDYDGLGRNLRDIYQLA